MQQPDMPGGWNEPAATDLDELTRWGTFAADEAVIGVAFATPADLTRAAVRAALRALMANGLIVPTIPDEIWFATKPQGA
jgi:DNA-binding GntR family transcriptional regulator